MELINFILHFEQHLRDFIFHYHGWIYALLFLIIFAETGFVVTPFLPGDSLLFTVGMLAAEGLLDHYLAFGLLMTAAVAGDNVNYWIGRYVGPAVFKSENSRLLNRKHLERAHAFYEKYGGKAIILARFVPIVRTFSPFVAGIATMHYPRFLTFCVTGGLLWMGIFIFGGYYFGSLPIVKQNFKLMILAIIILSVMPIVYEWLKARRKNSTGGL
jgi:membrane-associated protein